MSRLAAVDQPRKRRPMSRRPRLNWIPCFDSLEGRLTPSNLVLTSFSSTTGILTITAQDDFVVQGNNSQELTITGNGGGSYTVDGNNVTSINTVGTFSQTFLNVKGVALLLGLGNDTVTIQKASALSTTAFSLNVDGGSGANEVIIDAGAGSNTIGTVTITNSDGNDTFQVGNGTNTLGAVTINNGQGNSTIRIGQSGADTTTITGAFTATNGPAADSSTGAHTFATLGHARFSSNLTIKNSTGNSSTTFGTGGGADSTFIGGTLAVTNGFGSDTFTVGGSSFTVNVAARIVNGNGPTLTDFGQDGAVSITLGSPTSIAPALTIANLAGDDQEFIGNTTSTFTAKGVTVSNGNGQSIMKIGTTSMGNSTVTVNGNLTLTNGDGFARTDLVGASVNISGGATISYGHGLGTTEFGRGGTTNFTIGGTVAVSSADFGETCDIADSTGSWSSGSVTINGGTADDLGTGIGAFNGGSTTIHGNLTLANCPIAVFGGDSVSVSGNVVISSGNTYSSDLFGPGATSGAQTNFNFGGTVTIMSGNGGSQTKIDDSSGNWSSLGVTIKRGNDNGNGNTTTIGNGGNVTISGALAITNLVGTNHTTFQGISVDVTGAMTISNGNGDDAIDFGNNGATNFTVGAVTIINKDGPTSNLLADSTGAWSSLGVTISNGNGHNKTYLGSINGGTTLITGKLKVTSVGNTDFRTQGDSLTITDATTISAGSGDSSLTFNSTNILLTTVNFSSLGRGITNIRPATGSWKSQAVTITDGTGTGVLIGYSLGATVEIDGNLTVTNGHGVVGFGIVSGTNSLTITGNVAITGGNRETSYDVDFGEGGATNFNIGGTVTLTSLAGQYVSVAATESLANTTGTWTSGTITIKNSNGDTQITLGAAPGGSVQINGDLSITNADGNDTFTATGVSTQISGKVTMINGNGDSNDQFQAANLTAIGGNLSVTSLDGFDTFKVTSATFTVGGTTTLNEGSGGANITVTPATSGTLTGLLQIVAGGDGADSISLANLTVGGNDSITTGTGNDTIGIDTSTFGGMTFNTGAGADVLRIATGSTGFSGAATNFNGTFTALMGTGDDSVFLGTPASSTDFVQFNSSPVTLNGGNGVSLDSADFDLLFAFATYGANNVFPSGQPTVTGFESVQ